VSGARISNISKGALSCIEIAGKHPRRERINKHVGDLLLLLLSRNKESDRRPVGIYRGAEGGDRHGEHHDDPRHPLSHGSRHWCQSVR
jgi:hypothetical protein